MTSQSFCGARRMRAPLAPPRLSVPRNVDADAHAVETSCGDRQSRGQDLVLQRGDVLRVDQFVVDRRHRVLPQLRLLRHLRPQVARDRAHVAVRQLEPRPGEGVGELLRVLVEAARDLRVGRIEAQRQVRRQHPGRDLLRRVVGVRDRIGTGTVLRRPLLRAGRTRRQLPLVLEEVLEEIVAPPGGRGGPGDFETAGDGVRSPARLVAALPAEPLLFQVAALRFAADMLVGGRRTMGLAEGMATGDERHGLLVVHRHAAERLADVPRGGDRIGVAVRAFRVHVDEAHLHGAEGIGELAVAAVALVAEPRPFRSPVDLLGLPDVLTAAGETEGLEAHRLQGHVAGEDHQVGPGDLPPVLLLDRPEEPARLVDVGVVGPAAERREAYLARARAAAAVVDAVGAGAVPRHADEQPAVVAEVGRPPVLRGRHQLREVLLHGGEIEGLELGGVVEVLVHRIAGRVVPVQDREIRADSATTRGSTCH